MINPLAFARAHRTAVLAAGGGAAALVWLRHRHAAGGPTSAGVDANAATSGGGAGIATPGGVYDSTATDIYNSLEGQLEQLSGQVAALQAAGTVAPTTPAAPRPTTTKKTKPGAPDPHQLHLAHLEHLRRTRKPAPKKKPASKVPVRRPAKPKKPTQPAKPSKTAVQVRNNHLRRVLPIVRPVSPPRAYL